MWWLVAVLIVLAGTAGAAWQLRWYEPVYDQIRAATVTVKVLEDETFVLENATVTFRGNTFITDASGQATLTNAVAGSWELGVSKEGYTPYSGTVTLQRGANGTFTVSLKKEPPKLLGIKGLVTDYVTGLPMADALVSASTVTVKTDAAGGFTIDKLAAGDYTVTVSKANFTTLEKVVTVSSATPETQKLALVPTGRVLFVSNRDGKRALYTSAFDGSNQQQLIAPVAGTEDFGHVLSPDGKYLVFSSTRDKIANNFNTGYVSRLYLVGSDGRGLKKMADDVNPATVLWSPNSRYVYFAAYQDAKQTQFTRRFYDVTKGTTTDLGEAGSTLAFSQSGIHVAYSVSRQEGESYVYDIKTLDLVSGARRTVLEAVANYLTIPPIFSADDKYLYYETQINGTRKRFQVTFLTGEQKEVAVSTDASRDYTVSPDGKRKAFLDTRDGKKDLFTVDLNGENETRATTLGVVSEAFPVAWDATSRYLTFAVVREGESAVYIVSADGGEVRKIADFTLNSDPVPYY